MKKSYLKYVLYILIYLSGCVTTYINFREVVIKKFKHYTVTDRNVALCVSVTSWVGVGMLELMEYHIEHGDDEVNW